MPDTQRAMLYVRQVFEDEYVQEQLRHAAIGLRDAYERTRRERAQATEDKRLYANLRQAATSIRNAAMAIQKKPEPKPKRRRLPKVTVLALAVGSTAWLSRKRPASCCEAASTPFARYATRVSLTSSPMLTLPASSWSARTFSRLSRTTPCWAKKAACSA